MGVMGIKLVNKSCEIVGMSMAVKDRVSYPRSSTKFK